MKKFLFIIVIIICLIANLLAQDSTQALRYQPAQITFFYPIGIFGTHSQDYRYNFSLNILAGRTGGSEGFEAAGLININDHFIKGFQTAGIGNICNGPGQAFQSAGIFNIVNDDFVGFQAAGISNVVGGKTYASQFAGIANISGSSVEGAQFAGITNVCTGNSKCFQGAGIINISGNIIGAQVGGIGNIAVKADGAQVGGIFNTSATIDGLQLAGIANIAGNVDGVQLAGILNICDSIDGIPIALISYVRKNGYRKIELSYNEMQYMTATIKTGVRKFYTLFSAGYNPDAEIYNISYGYGVGTSILMKNKISALDIELRSNQLSDNFNTDHLLLNNSLIVDYSIILLKRIEVFAGPSLNVLVTDNSLLAADISPDWAQAYKYNNKVWGWLGFHAGVRF